MGKHRGKKNKRKGSQPVQTKRTPKNQHKWQKQAGYASRMLQRLKYFTLRLRNAQETRKK